MNKHFHNSLRALFLSLAVLLSLPMLAALVEIDGIRYDLNAETKLATVIRKSSGKYYGKVVIPESVEHEGTAYSVTGIGSEAFYDCSSLTSVTIGNSVTSIGRNAFNYCSGLTSVTIGNSVTSIGDYAFFECSGLTSVTIPNSVESIGEKAFCHCDYLTSVTIGNSVTSIGDWAFYSCSNLTSVHISDIAAWCNIDFHGDYSNPIFYAEHLYMNGEKVRDLVIPNSVTSIGDYDFSYCSGLTSVTIPNSVTSIGDYAFSGCSGLISVTIPNSVTSIGEWAFSGCSGLTSVTIPNSVTSIGESAFYGCSGLTSVTIPNSVTSIWESTFYGCSGLTSVTIPNSVTSIGSKAFANCSVLRHVYCYAEKVPSTHSKAFDGSYPKYVTLHVPAASVDSYKATAPWNYIYKIIALPTEIDGINYDFDAETKQATVIGKSDDLYSGEIVIPESVKYVGTVYSVTSIGDYAFSGCSGLTSVTIPNSVTSIGDYTFYGCSGLTSVTIPNSVTSIEYRTFDRCSGLTSVTIGNSVKSIGDKAFARCPELLDVYCYAEKVPSTHSNAFDGSYPEYATLHVPGASVDSYKSTAPWSGFGKIVGLSGEEPEQPEVEKCATPVVTYAEGKLSFSCETEGAEFVTDITDSDIKKHYDAEIELSATYNIEVFATKANCENSDTVSVALVWVENGEVNEETGVISVPAAPVLVQGNGGILTVSGVVQNTEVVVYTIDGMEVDRAVASDGTATIYTGLQSGTIVVVKFGNKSVKVRI